MEIGCGCALPSLVLSSTCSNCTIDVTDKDPLVLSNAQHNLSSTSCRVLPLDWADVPADLHGRYDHVIAADTCYRPELTSLMLQACKQLLRQGGLLWVVTPSHRQGVSTLLQGLQVWLQRGYFV